MAAIVLFASTSGIAQAIAEAYLQRKQPVILVARSQERLDAQAADLGIKYDTTVATFRWDLQDDDHPARAEALFATREIDGIIMAAGVMPPQEECEQDPNATIHTINCNLTAVSVILNLFADYFETRGKGFISCLSSVAGDRGRGSNYVYGASKAGLTAFLQGLRNRMHKHGILVQTVKPGPVKTAMTAHLKDSPVMADPDDVAQDILQAIARKQDVLYTPFYWRYIMTAIRWIPEPLFKRLSF